MHITNSMHYCYTFEPHRFHVTKGRTKCIYLLCYTIYKQAQSVPFAFSFPSSENGYKERQKNNEKHFGAALMASWLMSFVVVAWAEILVS